MKMVVCIGQKTDQLAKKIHTSFDLLALFIAPGVQSHLLLQQVAQDVLPFGQIGGVDESVYRPLGAVVAATYQKQTAIGI